jgi:amino acid adenylation domain-containing protein
MTLSPAGAHTQFTAVDFDPFAGGEVLLTAPATESQKEIWISVQMGDDANCAYNESQTLRLHGSLDIDALQAAFQSLVQRHESLRMTISPDGQNLCIHAEQTLAVPVLDLTDLAKPEQQIRLNAQIQAEARQPFDLEHGPLFRAQIVRLSPQEHWVLLTAHHIICDGWSWGVLMPELGQLYSALRVGKTPNLEAPDGFSDYALALEELSSSQQATTTEQFWLNQFADSVPVLNFPTDFPHPPIRTFDAARYDHALSADLVTALKQLGTQTGCSFMTVLLSSFEVFLYRLTTQTDLVVGISAAGQLATGNPTLVGHCVNLLPLRTQIKPEETFRTYLASRRSTILDAYDHQAFTFGRLLQKLALPRDPSRIPLVPVTFNVDQGLDGSKLPFDGLAAEFFSNPRPYENFELYLNATELGGQLTLECQYNTNLFSAATIRHRLLEFETLLKGITTQPNTAIAKLPLLPEAESQQLTQWIAPQSAPLEHHCLPAWFELQVRQTPSRIAVVFEEQQLTYQDLNQRANQLAHYLRQQGVKPNTPIGLCIERSLEMVVAMLGILKAGGAYIPLDPEYPIARLAYILENAQALILLTQQHLIPQLPSQTAQVILVDQDWDKIAHCETENLDLEIHPETLAYIIYTSGSTGKPKGVMVPHRAICNHMQWMQATFPLDQTDKVLQKTSFSFDASVWEFYAPLLVGAQLVLARPNGQKDVNYLIPVLIHQNITILQTVPTLLQLLLEQPHMRHCHSLKRVFCGGEPLTLGLQTRFFATLNAALINLYGPTEACIDTTFWQCQPTQQAGAIPIGQPMTNAQAYVLDANCQLLPIGVPGELYIGGMGLAQGYLNQPELTAAKFVPHPYNSDAEAKLYKTGDWARLLPNGQLEYLGRIDDQIKIRGFRIELAEVEAALSEHAAVQECAVVLWQANANEESPDERLVAYIVKHRRHRDMTAGEFRAFMQQRVPDFMVPSHFVLLDTLPLMPNGKIDRKALPQPEASHGMAETYVAPQTSTEQAMAEVWKQVLKLDQVGIHDNFFDLGGHSLLAAQLLAQIQQIFSVPLQLRALFEAPTIAALTERLETIRWVTHAKQQAASTNDNDANDYEEGEL